MSNATVQPSWAESRGPARPTLSASDGTGQPARVEPHGSAQRSWSETRELAQPALSASHETGQPARAESHEGAQPSQAESRGTGRSSRAGSRGAGRPSRSDAPSNAPADPVAQAREICLRLLTARPRTRAELHEALLRKGIPADAADAVLGRLNEVGLVDDAAFAEQWVRSRHTYQGMARRALAAELRRKGVADPVAAEAVAAVDSESEEGRARELVRKRLRALTAADELTKIRRLVAMLARKGYSEGMSYRVVREELRTAGTETALLDTPDPD